MTNCNVLQHQQVSLATFFILQAIQWNVTCACAVTSVMKLKAKYIKFHHTPGNRSTRYGLEGPGIESRWGEIFRAYPDRLWGRPSLVHNRCRVFPGDKGGRGVVLTTHPPSSVPRSMEKNTAVTPFSVGSFVACTRVKPIPGHEGPERTRYSSTLSLTSALDGGAWLTPRPSHFTAGKVTRYPLYRRLSRP
jgi:hypothetical protein